MTRCRRSYVLHRRPFNSAYMRHSEISTRNHIISPSAFTLALMEAAIVIPRHAKAIARDDELLSIRAYLDDPILPPIIASLPDSPSRTTAATKFIRRASDFFVLDGQLWRKHHSGNHKLVIPVSRRFALLVQAHTDLGHKGIFTYVYVCSSVSGGRRWKKTSSGSSRRATSVSSVSRAGWPSRRLFRPPSPFSASFTSTHSLCRRRRASAMSYMLAVLSRHIPRAEIAQREYRSSG